MTVEHASADEEEDDDMTLPPIEWLFRSEELLLKMSAPSNSKALILYEPAMFPWKLSDVAAAGRVEPVPETVAAEATGAEYDLLEFPASPILEPRAYLTDAIAESPLIIPIWRNDRIQLDQACL